MKKIDAHDYWINRHKQENSLAAVGLKSSSPTGNYYLYKIVREQYEKILSQLDLPENPRVLDAGCGIGCFVDLFLSRRFAVMAADISPDAVERLTEKYGNKIETVCSPLNKLKLDRTFDLVHSFDVLYHILDQREWEETLEKFAGLSRKYIVLHERFLTRKPVIASPHVRQRPYRVTADKLAELGFKEMATIPTHFLAMRILTYRLSRYLPRLFYRLDRLILDYLVNRDQPYRGSHHIKVFQNFS
ncbi:MAG: class I SAM-dependent methyltransferase [bacterium]